MGWGPSWTAPLCSRHGHPDWPAGEGRGEVGRRGGGLPARPRLVRPAGSRSLSGGPALSEPAGPEWPAASTLRAAVRSRRASARPQGSTTRPRGARALYPEGAWVRAGGRRRAAVGGRAEEAGRCAGLGPRAARSSAPAVGNLGPSWLRRWRPRLRVQGRRRPAGPGPRAPPRASSPPPPRRDNPPPGLLPGGTGPRTCLRDPLARSFSGQTPGRAWGVPLPGHPAHLPPTSPELCRVLREHRRTHWAAAPGAASAPAGSPQLTSNPRTRFILLWVPPRRRGPVISGSQTRAIPLVLDPWTAPGRAIHRVRTAPAAGLTRNAFQKENARPHHFWDTVLAELLR